MTVLRALLVATLAGFLLAPPASAGTLWVNCKGRLCRTDEDGNRKRAVLGLVGGRPIEDAAVAPDGRRIAASDGVNVFLASPGGRWRQVPRARGGCCSTGRFHWRRDGRAFMWRRSNAIGSMEMCTATRAGRRVRCRTTTGEGGIDLFGPRGSLIYKPGHEQGLCVRVEPPRACGRKVLRPPVGYEPFNHATLSPDGRSIAAFLSDLAGGGRLGIFAVATGKPTRALWKTQSTPTVHWSPDGRWIAQVVWRAKSATSARIRLRAARGRATRTITIPAADLLDWTR